MTWVICDVSHRNAPSQQVWRLVSKHVLDPDLPFELHTLLYGTTYKGWDAARLGPPPSWIPDASGVQSSNLARFMREWQVPEDLMNEN